jgi:hypothetical protein
MSITHSPILPLSCDFYYYNSIYELNCSKTDDKIRAPDSIPILSDSPRSELKSVIVSPFGSVQNEFLAR